MIKIENFEVVGWEHAFRGMRNPKNSWAKSDSSFHEMAKTEAIDYSNNPDGEIKPWLVQFDALDIGEKDHELAMKLVKGGPVHAKFRRMITVYVDITAPLYWWKEYDTYKVGTVANSCSTMHKIHDKEFTLDDFSHEHLVSGWVGRDSNGVVISIPGPKERLESTIELLNNIREVYLKIKNTPKDQIDWSITPALSAKEVWHQMIQLLPSSYNQKRTLKLNYEVLANIYTWRKNHKLDEWREFCSWIESLPYSEIITGKVEEESDD